MRIVTDTSSLYSPEEGKKFGIDVVPACAIIDGVSYKDYEDISSEEFLERIKEGVVPTTSQPAIGDLIDIFEGTEDDIVFFGTCDGLSGIYQNAMGAKNSIEDNEHIVVLDSKTLAGPQHYLVEKAMQLRDKGVGLLELAKELQKSIDNSISFVIPFDFNFLKRSGRVTSLVAAIGNAVKIVPVMTQTEDRKRIKPFAIKRSKKKAVEAIIEHLQQMGVDEKYVVSICHGGAPEAAKEVLEQIKAKLSNATYEMYMLSPALITHGGPDSIVIQAILK